MDELEDFDVLSIEDCVFESDEVKNLVKKCIERNKFSNNSYDHHSHTTTTSDHNANDESDYRRNRIFPQWILNTTHFTSKDILSNSQDIPHLFKLTHEERTVNQTSMIVNWLMSVWDIAKNMEHRRVEAMIKEFKHHTYLKNDYIFKEGDRGLTFYIIVEGECIVIKDGVGVVDTLSARQNFGEVALTQGKDLRTVSIQAITPVVVISLHKLTYDQFISDFILNEVQENAACLKVCKLFFRWARKYIDKMASTCIRKTYEQGSYVFRKGDDADYLYILTEGSVGVVVDAEYTSTNRWPNGMYSWEENKVKTTKKFIVMTLNKKGDFFGEVAVIKKNVRATSVVCLAKTSLLCIGQEEFNLLINRGGDTTSSATTTVTDDATTISSTSSSITIESRQVSSPSVTSTNSPKSRSRTKISKNASAISPLTPSKKLKLMEYKIDKVSKNMKEFNDSNRVSSVSSSHCDDSDSDRNREYYKLPSPIKASSYDNTTSTKPLFTRGCTFKKDVGRYKKNINSSCNEYDSDGVTTVGGSKLSFGYVNSRSNSCYPSLNNSISDDSSSVGSINTDVSRLTGIVMSVNVVDKNGKRSKLTEPIVYQKMERMLSERLLSLQLEKSVKTFHVNSHDSYDNSSNDSNNDGYSLTSSISNDDTSANNFSVNSFIGKGALAGHSSSSYSPSAIEKPSLLHKSKLSYRDVMS